MRVVHRKARLDFLYYNAKKLFKQLFVLKEKKNKLLKGHAYTLSVYVWQVELCEVFGYFCETAVALALLRASYLLLRCPKSSGEVHRAHNFWLVKTKLKVCFLTRVCAYPVSCLHVRNETTVCLLALTENVPTSVSVGSC